MKRLLLALAITSVTALSAQKTATTKVKMTHLHLPTLPMEGVKTIGLQVHTGTIPFNADTLRFYLGNMEMMKSGGERLSAVKYKGLTQTSIVGGTGDITIDMAFGQPTIGKKELLEAQCMVAKDGCKQYYYKVTYALPAVVQATKGGTVLETWELDEAMTLQFGNEQVETQSKKDGGSTTSVRVVNYTSREALDKAFASSGDSWLARKAAVIQLGRLADSMYPRLFAVQDEMKFDLTYGKGEATDYTETQQAAEQAAAVLASGEYSKLAGPIATWEQWLTRLDASDKKAAVNPKIAEGLHENIAMASAFSGDYPKARTNLDKTLTYAQQGMVNENNVARLKAFHTFIDDLEKSRASNGTASTSALADAPDIKQLLGRRKFNEDFDFLKAEDRYAEMKSGASSAASSGSAKEPTMDDVFGALLGGGGGSYESRSSGGVLILNSFSDKDLAGQPIPETICSIAGLKSLNARNMGLTGVPECIGQLNGLDKLFLDGNAITVLPESLGQLGQLTVLDVSNNQLSALPESIYSLQNLKKLTVTGNKLSAEQMKTLAERLPNCKIK